MRKLVSILLLCVLVVGCSNQTEFIEPSNHSVYYEIFVPSFKDSDGDGVGDIQGIIESLDYIQKDLGASSIWLMPIHPSPTYHKYDVTDYLAIDESYGTMEDFEALIKELKERDMTLILDLVINHTSSEHPWFKQATQDQIAGTCDTSEYCDYYNFSSTDLGGYTKVKDDVYYESVFWSEMPDLNLDNEAVRNEIEAIGQFWIDKGVDGFRLDATTHYYAENKEENIAFLDWFSESMRSYKSDVYLVGEAWTSGQIIKDMYASGINSLFNFSFSGHDGLINTSINNQDGLGLANAIYNYNTEIKSYSEYASDAVFLSNHDTGRSGGYLKNIDKQKLSASIYLLMPGNVFIYYGEEIGMLGSGIDENKRLALPWDPNTQAKDPESADYNKDQPTMVREAIKDPESLLNYYHDVIQIRNAYPEIVDGPFDVLDLDNKALMSLEYQNVIIVHNLSDEAQSISMDNKILKSLNHGARQEGDHLIIEGYSSVVIEK